MNLLCKFKGLVILGPLLSYETIPSGKGKKNLILLQGYTFSVQGGSSRKYYCSSKHKTKCQAKVSLDQNMAIDYGVLQHNHPAPRYYRTTSGALIKLSH